MPDGVDTTRDAVAAAFKEVSARSEPAPAPEPVAEPAPEPASAAPEPEAAEPSKDSKVRDGKGRFIVPPKAKPAVSEKAPASAGTQGQGGAVSVPPPAVGAAPPVPALEALKPPQDWRAQAREKWGTLPREIQEEALRTHIEARKVLSDSAELRKNFQTYQQATQPYEAMIRAEGLEPHQAVGLLLQREAALRTAPLAVKAKILAHQYNTFLGTSPEAIEAFALAVNGQTQQGGPQAQPQIDPRQIVAQAKQEFAQEMQQRQIQFTKQQGETDVQQFESSHEYMEDDSPGSVRDLTGYVMQADIQRYAAAKQSGDDNVKPLMTMDEAYQQALRMHPKTSAIVAQKEAAKAATARAATMQQARAASSSLKNEPSGPMNGKPKDVREAVAEAYYAQKNAR